MSAGSLALTLVNHVAKPVRHGWFLLRCDPNQKPAGFAAGRSSLPETGDYMDFILSVTTEVQAPSGSLVMTGSDPPDSRLSTVRR
jgi:hypothetical protein